MSADGPDEDEHSELVEAADTDRPLWHVLTTSGRPHLPYLGASVGSISIAATLDMAEIFVLGIAIDALFNEKPYTLPLIPDGWIPPQQLDQLWFTVALLVAMKVADIAVANASQYTSHLFGQRVLHDLRIDAFDAAQRLELGFFEDSRTGDVMSVLNNDVNELEEFLGDGIRFAAHTTSMVVAAVALMLVLNWQLALFVVVTAPIVAVVNWWFSTALERLQDAVRSELGALNARLETSLSGINVIKAFTGEAHERRRFEDASREHYVARWNSKRLSARHGPSMRLISGTTLVVTFAIGTVWVVSGPPLFFSGTLTAGTLVPFLFYLQHLTGPMRWIAPIVEQYKAATAAAKRIVGLRHTDRIVDDTDGADLPAVDGRVTYDEVRFSYPGTDEPVLDGVSVSIEPGETVGVVGSTGAGKSTLIKLLLRFYDVDEGAVTVDGVDVRTVTRRSLRRQIGYVDQDPVLFDGTIAENVAYGDPDADEDAVVAAAREAGVHRFVRGLAEGYDTQVGERGVKLSGGQRQRIAIARAIVSDPPILLFDEATSHVDNETEVLIQRNLEALTEDRTTVVVAHRLSTVRDADRILVLEDGQLVESGAHDDLVESGGTYATLWHVQTGDLDALPADLLAGDD